MESLHKVFHNIVFGFDVEKNLTILRGGKFV